MFGNANFDSYFDAPETDAKDAQLTALKIQEKFERGDFEWLSIEDAGIPDEGSIDSMEFYDDDEGRVVLVEWSYSEPDDEDHTRMVRSSGSVELDPDEKFNIWYS